MFQSQIVSHKSKKRFHVKNGKGSVEKKVGTEPTAFSPLSPSKDLSFISLNLYFRLSSVSVLLTPQQITLCSNEVAEFKTINLLLTAVLSCTSNNSICLNSHMPVWCCVEEKAKATTLK